MPAQICQRVRPNLSRIWPNSVEFGRHQPKSGRCRGEPGRDWLMSVCSRPTSAKHKSKCINPGLPLGHSCWVVDQSWPTWDRPTSTRLHVPRPEELAPRARPILADVDRSRSTHARTRPLSTALCPHFTKFVPDSPNFGQIQQDSARRRSARREFVRPSFRNAS